MLGHYTTPPCVHVLSHDPEIGVKYAAFLSKLHSAKMATDAAAVHPK